MKSLTLKEQFKTLEILKERFGKVSQSIEFAAPYEETEKMLSFYHGAKFLIDSGIINQHSCGLKGLYYKNIYYLWSDGYRIHFSEHELQEEYINSNGFYVSELYHSVLKQMNELIGK